MPRDEGELVLTAKRLETWIWVLIYGGLIALSLGWFVTPREGPWGEMLIGGGAVTAAIGCALIVVRSRMKE